MNVLVTGATGFLGANLVQYLLADRENVRIFARLPAKAESLVKQGAQVVIGDITNREIVYGALQGIEIVYHVVGKLFAPDVPPGEFYRTHVEGARTLLDCCWEQPSLKRVVYVSTTGVLGEPGDWAADEGAPCAPTNAYEHSKWKAEQLVRDAIEQGFPAVIVRPGLVYGPGDLHLLGFYRAIQRGLFRPIGNHAVWLSVIYVADMAEALVCCGQHPSAVGKCFNIAHPTPVTIASLSSTIAAALGKTIRPQTIPMPVASAVATIGDLLPTRLKPLAPLTHSRLDFLTHSRYYDVTKSQRVLGFVAKTDLPAGIARTVAWYRQEGYLPEPQHKSSDSEREKLF